MLKKHRRLCSVGLYGEMRRRQLVLDGDQIAVPDNRELRRSIIKELHDAPYAGHLGYTKTLKHIQRYFYWYTVES